MKASTKLNATCLLVTAGASLMLALDLPAAEPKVDLGKLPPPAKKTGVTFAADVKAVFDTHCVKCHSGAKPKGSLHLDSREGALKGGEDGAMIVPGKSEQSKLVWYVADLVQDMEMPPPPKRRDFPALTREQIALVRAWIDQGAK